MKEGLSLSALATEVERQQKQKHDYIADTRKLEMTEEKELRMKNGKVTDYKLTNYAHGQIATRLKIPQRYYDMMSDMNPSLLAANVNSWFQTKPEIRMVRTLDGTARAFLSNKYRTLDNYDLLSATLPLLKGKELQIKSSQITDTNLYMQIVFPKLAAQIRKGDIVQSGVIISNSEVGAGSIRVEPLVYRLVCENGLITSSILKTYHIEKFKGGYDSILELLSDSTKRMTDQAFWNQFKDVVSSTMSEKFFKVNVDRMQNAARSSEMKDPETTITELVERHSVSDEAGELILKNLIKGKDLTMYGAVNAFTATANDVERYDETVDLERIGGKILELNSAEWEVLAS